MSFKLNGKYIRLGNQIITYNEQSKQENVGLNLIANWTNPDYFYNGVFVNGYNGPGSLMAYSKDIKETGIPIIHSNEISTDGKISDTYKIDINIINIKTDGMCGLNFYLAESSNPLTSISDYSLQYDTNGIKSFELTLKNDTTEPIILVCFMIVGNPIDVGFNLNSAAIYKV